MSKLYALLAFSMFVLVSSKTNAQTTDSCRADFEITPSTNSNILTVGLHALPWSNHDKKPEQICWNFGDNRDTCIQYDPSLSNNYFVSHTYTQTGAYTICIKILYQGGCQSGICKTIQTGSADSCKASFETLASTANSPGEYFVAQPWHNHNKRPVYICWDFGDTHDTCIQYSTNYTGNYGIYHLYSHNDNYNVCVKIQYDGGCESYYCHPVRIGESPDSCSANFETIASTANSPGEYFVAQPWHNHNKRPVYICWNFGDNHDTCIQYSNTTAIPYNVYHTYAAPGQYEVCVRIVYDGGCESKNCKVIKVGEVDSCTADFEKISSPTANNFSYVYFRALPKNDHEKRPARICWSFGDGKDSCIYYTEDFTGSYTVGHHYDQSGVYEVCVSINYYGGCEAKKCKNLEIFLYNADTCRVKLYETSPSITSLAKEFYFVSSNPNKPLRVCWSFGDGTDTCLTAEADSSNIPYSIKHTYPAPGIYQACVKVLFRNGCTAYNCIEINVRSLTDLCGGYYSDSLVDPHTYLFRGFSVHRSDDAVVSYRWTFGDGTSGNGEKISHTYQHGGVYRVCLLINTEKGCETRICDDVRIAGETQSRLQISPNPVADILHVLFYSIHNETASIKIINSNGVVVKSFTVAINAGANMWNFEAAGLLTGIYSLTLQSSDQFASVIFFKQ
ncbi:MAG: PKD domain-containing protein [Chitinophagales bacterium]